MNYTLNNHLYYTIGGRKFGYRRSPYDQYKVFAGTVDKDLYRTSSWRQELRRTADTVLSEYGKDLVVFLSGGTDSEIVLRNFLEIGHKPRCVSIKFTNDLNKPDIDEAIEIAKSLNVKLDLIDFDVKDFYRSGLAKEFSQEIDCSQITYLMVYYHVYKLGAPAVMGGKQLLRRAVPRSGSYWYHCFRENEDASAMRFSEKYKIPLVNEWFSYTPEMMLFFLEDSDIVKLTTTRYNYKLASVTSKNAILKKLFPEIKERPKTHGFERLLGFNGEVYKKLKLGLTPKLTTCLDGIPIDVLMKQLKGE